VARAQTHGSGRVSGPGGVQFTPEQRQKLGQRGVELFLACFGNDRAALERLTTKHLMTSPVNVNLHTQFGELEMTPLHAAIQASDRGVVELLLSKGAQISSQDFAEAVNLGRVDIAQLLLDRGMAAEALSPSAPALMPLLNRLLIDAAERGDMEAIPFLLNVGADVNCSPRWGDRVAKNPITAAIEGARPDAATLLLERGARVGPEELYAAVRLGRAEVLESLLAAGADPNATKWDEALLHIAVKYGGPDCVQVLLKHGAAAEVRNAQGETPLQLASSAGAIRSAELLLAHGAELNAADRGGLTPLGRAFESGHHEMAALLTAAGAEAKVCAEEHEFGRWTYFDRESHQRWCRRCGEGMREPHGGKVTLCNNWPDCDDDCQETVCPACGVTVG
jgi:ankyrin repeat protein